jgi:uncharacterized membrane protein
MTPIVTLLLAAYLIICAIGGALIGDRKGHKINGMFFGLLLGLIGVIVALLPARRPAA